jgi:hypothetical protein
VVSSATNTPTAVGPVSTDKAPETPPAPPTAPASIDESPSAEDLAAAEYRKKVAKEKQEQQQAAEERAKLQAEQKNLLTKRFGNGQNNGLRRQIYGTPSVVDIQHALSAGPEAPTPPSSNPARKPAFNIPRKGETKRPEPILTTPQEVPNKENKEDKRDEGVTPVSSGSPRPDQLKTRDDA